jgi:glycosyltransferase involved in cell wall biosynthesis
VPEAPLWSILLPTHHSPDTIGAAIDSVLAQTEGDFELFVVGDGVNDETRSALARFDDARINFVDRPKGSGWGYLNRAEVMREARGRYIGFTSDDDLWAPDHLARLGELLAAGATIAHSRSFWCVPDGRLVPVPFDAADPLNAERFARGNYIPANCWAVTAEAFERAGGWPTEVERAADWELWKAIMALPASRAASTGRITSLHFRSRLRDYDLPSVAAMLRLVAARGGWPDDSRVHVPAGADTQGTVVRASSLAAQDWWDRAATAADRLIDRVALLALEDVDLVEGLEARIAALDAELSAHRSTISWRVTAPLRRIRRLGARRT